MYSHMYVNRVLKWPQKGATSIKQDGQNNVLYFTLLNMFVTKKEERENKEKSEKENKHF